MTFILSISVFLPPNARNGPIELRRTGAQLDRRHTEGFERRRSQSADGAPARMQGEATRRTREGFYAESREHFERWLDDGGDTIRPTGPGGALRCRANSARTERESCRAR